MREAVWGTQLADSTLPSLAFPPSDVDLKWPLPVASAIPTKPSIKSPSGHMSASQAPDNGVSLGHDFSMTPGPKLQLTHSPQRPFTTLPQVCDVDYQGSSTHSPPPPSGKSPRSSNPVSTQAMCHADVELSQLNHRSRGLMNSLSLTHTHTPHPHAGSHAYISKVGGIPGVAGAHLFLGSPTPTKRQRTSQTCEKCRERKAKCNGARPTCQRCAARAQIYEYAKERQTKKPDKTPPPRYSVSDVVSLSTPIIPNRFKYVWPTADCSSAQNDGSLTLPSPPIVSPTQHCLVATSHLVLTPPKPTQKQAEGNGTTATTKSSTDPQISFSENGGCSQRTTGAVPMLGRRNTSPPLALGFKPVNSSPLVFYSPTPICQLPTIDMILSTLYSKQCPELSSPRPTLVSPSPSPDPNLDLGPSDLPPVSDTIHSSPIISLAEPSFVTFLRNSDISPASLESSSSQSEFTTYSLVSKAQPPPTGSDSLSVSPLLRPSYAQTAALDSQTLPLPIITSAHPLTYFIETLRLAAGLFYLFCQLALSPVPFTPNCSGPLQPLGFILERFSVPPYKSVDRALIPFIIISGFVFLATNLRVWIVLPFSVVIAGTIEAGRQRTPVGRKNSVPTRGKAHGMVLSPGSSHKFSRQPFHVQLLGFIDNIMEGLTVSSLLGRVMQAHISVTSIFILPDIYELKMFQPSEVPIHFVGDLRASDPDRSEVIHLKEDTNPNSGPHRILGDLSSLCLLVSDKQPNMPVTKGSCIQHPRLGYERSEADTILPKPFGESGSTKTATTPPSATPGTEHQYATGPLLQPHCRNNSNDPPQAFEVTAVKLLAFLLASHDTLKQLSGPIKGSCDFQNVLVILLSPFRPGSKDPKRPDELTFIRFGHDSEDFQNMALFGKSRLRPLVNFIAESLRKPSR